MVAIFTAVSPKNAKIGHLKNRVPIIGSAQKLVLKFSLAIETLLKKDRTIETFLAAKMTSSIFDVTSFPTFSYKNTSTGAIYLKLAGLLILTLKSQKLNFRPVAQFLTKI